MSFDPLIFAGSVVVGMALAAVYLRALRTAVARLTEADNPHRSLLVGIALRLSLALLVLVLAAQAGPEALAGGLAGFVSARTLILWRVRRAIAAQ